MISLARIFPSAESVKAEFFMAPLALAVASFVAAPDIRGLLGAALGNLMLAIAKSDWRRYIVPDALSMSALALGLVHAYVASFDAPWVDVATAILRAALTAGLLLAVRVSYRRLRGREGLGLGDVKLAAVAGAWLNLTMLPIAIEIAAASTLAFYLWRQWRRRRAPRAVGRAPFGAFFALSIWAAWLLEAGLADLT